MKTLDMILIPHPSNSKTGDIIQSYTGRDTCPQRCPFKGNGCYADSIYTRRVWERCGNPMDSRHVSSEEDLYIALLGATASHAQKGEKRVLFRHNVAGDLAEEGTNDLSLWRVNSLEKAIKRINLAMGGVVTLKGYTYTHCTIDSYNSAVIRTANARGFTINYSCETVKEVMDAVEYGCTAVLTAPDADKAIDELERANLRACQCPAQISNKTTCATCGACANAHRKAVIVFQTHGSSVKKANKVIMLKKA